MKPPFSSANYFHFFLLCLLPSLFLCQSDISGCCTQVRIESSGKAGEHQHNRLGLFVMSGVYSDRPVYRLSAKKEFLFYLQSRGAGLWMVGPEVGQFNGGLANKGDTYCPEDLPANKWKYTDGSAWHVENQMSITCEERKEDPECVYSDGTEFVGGDLHGDLGGGGLETDKKSSAECIEECDNREGCNYWTWLKGEKVNCFLKKTRTDSVRRNGYVSGSTSGACDKTQLNQKEGVVPKFNKNEINGRFKITSLKWNEKLKNPDSQEFKDLANTIEDSIGSMLKDEKELSEKVDFSVSVQRFKKGSVVCDFKVNYIKKEAWIAIPFAIKPSDITQAMNKNFKFKKGILFQRFLIAANSFNTTTPVDHCTSKGCSHKCNYDYDVEEYVCTCPRSLVLGRDLLNCITEEEADKEINKEANETPQETDEEDIEEESGPSDEIGDAEVSPNSNEFPDGSVESSEENTDSDTSGWIPDSDPLESVDLPQPDVDEIDPGKEPSDETKDALDTEEFASTDADESDPSVEPKDTTIKSPDTQDSLGAEDYPQTDGDESYPSKEPTDLTKDSSNDEDQSDPSTEPTDTNNDSLITEDSPQTDADQYDQSKEPTNTTNDPSYTEDQSDQSQDGTDPTVDSNNFPQAATDDSDANVDNPRAEDSAKTDEGELDPSKEPTDINNDSVATEESPQADADQSDPSKEPTYTTNNPLDAEDSQQMDADQSDISKEAIDTTVDTLGDEDSPKTDEGELVPNKGPSDISNDSAAAEDPPQANESDPDKETTDTENSTQTGQSDQSREPTGATNDPLHTEDSPQADTDPSDPSKASTETTVDDPNTEDSPQANESDPDKATTDTDDSTQTDQSNESKEPINTTNDPLYTEESDPSEEVTETPSTEESLQANESDPGKESTDTDNSTQTDQSDQSKEPTGTTNDPLYTEDSTRADADQSDLGKEATEATVDNPSTEGSPKADESDPSKETTDTEDSTQTEADENGQSDNNNDSQDTEDTTKAEIDESDPSKEKTDIIDDISDPEDSAQTDEDTKQPGVHEFDCKEILSGQLGTGEGKIPLECVVRGGQKPRTLYFVINELDISGDISRLWDDNVKVVVKDLMVMDISPK
eukprot:GFUD01099904.1.p1 GENE.GFUD01099904.1~~GFUD01099904.1.p1  ORF type:complete len:1109 (+),score=396.10 GFUD01099904.1:107-3433(+)